MNQRTAWPHRPKPFEDVSALFHGSTGTIGFNKASQQSREGQIIPKIIHYVWVGSPFPDAYKGYLESWKIANPDYQFICWNESNIDFDISTIKELYRRKKYK